MDSKVFVARVPDEPYMEISSGGDFGNPMVSTFSLRDTNKYKFLIQQYYVIILNHYVSYLQLEVIGGIPGFNMEVAWVNDSEQFASKVIKEQVIDATNTKEALPFFVRYKVLDDLDIITMDQYKNIIQLRLVWA